MPAAHREHHGELCPASPPPNRAADSGSGEERFRYRTGEQLQPSSQISAVTVVTLPSEKLPSDCQPCLPVPTRASLSARPAAQRFSSKRQLRALSAFHAHGTFVALLLLTHRRLTATARTYPHPVLTKTQTQKLVQTLFGY